MIKESKKMKCTGAFQKAGAITKKKKKKKYGSGFNGKGGAKKD